ncbi:unnamed protein product [Rotaria sp. Silwood1]|nr:unnamed protein product [Rotaria sp. Silwood1]
MQCFCCLACVYAFCRTGSRKNAKGCCKSFSTFKALHRFITLDCNCPCYRARPKIRFRLRFDFLFICLILRGAAIYLYKSVSLGDTQRKDILGDRPCTTDPCRNRHLSHVVVFHGNNYKPQARCEFRASDKGMLGKCVYFARSIADTIGKAQCEGGACIIAKIRMGKVFEFDKQTIYSTGKSTQRDQQLYHFKKQIIKWVVMVDKEKDPKVEQYGLDIEFDSTECYCI